MGRVLQLKFTESCSYVLKIFWRIINYTNLSTVLRLTHKKAILIDESKFLLPQDDGLPARSTKEYVQYKLKSLAYYLNITNTAMYSKWSTRYFIDLQAGSGKNKIGNDFLLGSPLIALTAPHPATHFRFNENNADLENAQSALQMRVEKSPIANRVEIYNEDANIIVDKICQEINGHSGSLNIAFLDPDGLELKWSTVAKLASIKRMDLIINFSTSGIVRNIGIENFPLLNEFFGTDQWIQVDTPNDPVKRRRAFIDFYRQRLEKFGYYIAIDPDLGGHDIAVTNSKNSQVYSMIFASKHKLGDDFWKKAAKSVTQPKLL